jgi:hypothetical protein
VLAPIFAILVRSAPANADTDTPEFRAQPQSENDFTFAEALASPAYWLIAISTSIYGLISSGMSLFNESLLVQQGFEKGAYYELSKMTTVVGLLANLTTGCVTTRVRMTVVTGGAMAILASALLCLPLVKTKEALFCYAFAMGCAGGMVTVLFFAAFARLFGRAHLGSIQGLAQMMTVLFSAMGPVVLAEVHARTKSYLPATQSLGIICVILAVLVTIVPVPQHRVESSGLETPNA